MGGFRPPLFIMDYKSLLQEEFEKACQTPSDINEHLPLLKSIADECSHATEMGVRAALSTRAFLNSSCQTVISYDIETFSNLQFLFDAANNIGKRAEYIKADVLGIEIEQTDFLFIDTWHAYDQLIQELRLHGNKVNKYIGFHDTHTFGIVGENSYGKIASKGLLYAIDEYMKETENTWRVKIQLHNNNGLTILEKNL